MTFTRIHTSLKVGITALLAACALVACDENVYDDDATASWSERNAQAFRNKLSEARSAIAAAQQQYGSAWEDHCPYRAYRTYAMSTEGEATATDSICVEVLERGTAPGSPLFTDSVRINYLGRTLSADATAPLGTLGKAFDHSGPRNDEASIFSPDFCTPALMKVSNTIEGFSTALLHMQRGDKWRVYIPQELGYGASVVAGIPAYSTLVFDLQLKAYYRAGTVAGPWR